MRTLIFGLLSAFAATTVVADPAIEFKVATRGARLNLRSSISETGVPGPVLASIGRGSKVRLDLRSFFSSLQGSGVTAQDREAFIAHQDCRTLGALWSKFLARGAVNGREHRFLPVIYTQSGGRVLSGFVSTAYLSAGDLDWSCEDFQRALVAEVSNEQARCGLECLLSRSPSAQLARDLAGPLARILEGGESEAAEARALANQANLLCASASTPEVSVIAEREPEIRSQIQRLPGADQEISIEVPNPESSPSPSDVLIEANLGAFRPEVADEHGFRDPFDGLTVFNIDHHDSAVVRPNLADSSCPLGFASWEERFAWMNADRARANRCSSYAVKVIDRGDAPLARGSTRGKSGYRGPGYAGQEQSIDSFYVSAFDGNVVTEGEYETEVGRQYRFYTPETARNAAVQITDQMTSSVSNNITKVFVLFPRTTRPSMRQLADGRLEATLTTGEKAYFDPATRRLIPEGSALTERGWVDRRTDRFVRRVPVDYVGRGISVSVWSRTFRSPVDSQGYGPIYAEVSQPDPSRPGQRIRCSVRADKLWFQDQESRSDDRYEEFKFSTDEEFYAFLRTVTRDDESGRPCRIQVP